MLVPLFLRELRPGRRPAWQFSWQYFESMRDDWGQRLPNCGSRKSEINVVERTRIWRYRQEIRLPSIRTFMRRAKKCYLRRYNLFTPALIAPWPVRNIPHVFSRSPMGCWCRVRSWEYKLVHRIEILFMCKIQVRSCTLSISWCWDICCKMPQAPIDIHSGLNGRNSFTVTSWLDHYSRRGRILCPGRLFVVCHWLSSCDVELISGNRGLRRVPSGLFFTTSQVR